ncbi:TOM core complex subunit Tom6 [Cordyceps militaris]|uniref:TOM core complex subunit Tom6 n=1 Tax=Cordyceps militaris TaxID=73501 RepID=A0A2H4SHT7_CORMI|nr:TOM core complex subunit Tom6 [Cordyceps militaris]
MPPKRVLGEKHGRHAAAPKGYIAATYDTLTSPDNASVVRSIAVFGAAVAFLSSPFSEFLLPP